MLIWLHYSFLVVFWKALLRTLMRNFGRQTIFSGNRESIRRAFLSRGSMILWVIKTFHDRRKATRSIVDGDDFPGLMRVELRNQVDADQFFISLRDS